MGFFANVFSWTDGVFSISFCKHKWEYYTEHYYLPQKNKYNIKKLDNTPMRKCKLCDKKQHHLMPKVNGEYKNWKDFNLKLK